MVEQSRRPSPAVSLQAGPGQADTGTLLDLRIGGRTAREFGRQLAAVGDQLDRERTGRPSCRLPAPLHLLGPTQTPPRTRDANSPLWGAQGLSAALKAWVAKSSAGKDRLGTTAPSTRVPALKPEAWSGWSRGAVLALLAAAGLLGALWLDWKE